MNFIKKHLSETVAIAEQIDYDKIEKLVENIAGIREKNGRLFFLGVGGSAGNCAHAVNDFRKLCQIECYAPTDNVSELTARANDEGWHTIFSNWLATSNLSANDGIMIFSVGGGDREKNISPNIVEAIDFSKTVGAKIFSIVGRTKGYAFKHSDIAVHVPIVNVESITPHSEAFQAVVWHAMVSHPKLKKVDTKWESTK